MDAGQKTLENRYYQIMDELIFQQPSLTLQISELKAIGKELINKPNSNGFSLAAEVAKIIHEVKSGLKSISKKYETDKKLFECYKKIQNLHKFLTEDKITSEKLVITNLSPFFEGMHLTSTQMRKSMLQQIKEQTNKRLKLEKEYQNLYIAMREAILRKEKRINQLEQEIVLLEDKVNNQMHGKTNLMLYQHENMKGRIDLLERQIEQKAEREGQLILKLERLEQDLKNERRQKNNLRQQLKNEIKHHKEEQTKVQQDEILLSPQKVQTMINQAIQSAYTHGRSQSKEKQHHSQQSDVDNVLGSFSQIPHQRNLTSLENTFTHHSSDRKAKSAYGAPLKGRHPDDLWQFLLIQANTIEEFSNVDGGGSYQL